MINRIENLNTSLLTRIFFIQDSPLAFFFPGSLHPYYFISLHSSLTPFIHNHIPKYNVFMVGISKAHYCTKPSFL